MENTEVIKKEEDKVQPKYKTILTIVGNVVFYAVIILLFLFSLMNINAGNGQTDFPHLFGRGMLSVQTNSMERKSGGYQRPEWETYKIQNIDAGDLVNVKVFKKKNFSKLAVGDVITFVDSSLQGKDTMLNTHRIVYIGDNFVVCQGDYVVTSAQNDSYAYDLENPLSEKNYRLSEAGDTQTVNVSDIKGVVTSVSRGTGKILTNIRSNWLFYFVIPVAVILLVEIFFVFKNILDLKNEKNKAALASDKETMMADLEAEKEKMRQELLAEMRAQMAAEAKPIEEPKEEVKPEETIETPAIEVGIDDSVAEETTEEASDADVKEE